ncbi:MAG: hypothetical protein KC652_26105 [Cyanobacteria bacterium HKST-UBA01]|nr:hypothetical protein [Cyanobacteria bacterium HKST-UBA01]
MNRIQRLVFLLGVVVIALMGSCPPWKEAGPKGLPVDYAPIYSPPKPLNPAKGLEIDFARLLLQIGVAGVLTGGLITASSTQPEKLEDKSGSGSSSSSPEPKPMKPISNKQEEDEEEEEDDDDDDDDLDVGETVLINFPKGKVLGELLVEATDDPDSWDWYANVEGPVKMPLDKPVQLEIVKKDSVDLGFLTLLKPDSLHSIDLTNCRLNDWELSNLSGLKGLKEIDLTGASISSEALTYFDNLENLEKLWLDGTNVDDQSVASLAKLKKLKKLSLRKTKVSDTAVDKLRADLSQCKFEV